MGAVIAAAFSSGLSYDELLIRVAAVSQGEVARVWPPALLGPYASHLLRAGPLRATIADLVPARRFSELAVPLTVTATDEATGQLALFGAGGADAPLLDVLYASCALPVFYPPGKIDGRSYIDGGMRAVLPLDVASQFEPDLIFAVNVGPTLDGVPASEKSLPGMVRSHDTAIRILMASQVAETIDRWRSSAIPLVLVEPQVEPGTFAVGRAFAHVEAGYRAAYRELARWEKPRRGTKATGRQKRAPRDE
jgi:NTE family protein